MAAGFMTHVTCRLTAKNRDQLRNPTLGNREYGHLYLFSLLLKSFWAMCCAISYSQIPYVFTVAFRNYPTRVPLKMYRLLSILDDS